MEPVDGNASAHGAQEPLPSPSRGPVTTAVHSTREWLDSAKTSHRLLASGVDAVGSGLKFIGESSVVRAVSSRLGVPFDERLPTMLDEKLHSIQQRMTGLVPVDSAPLRVVRQSARQMASMVGTVATSLYVREGATPDSATPDGTTLDSAASSGSAFDGALVSEVASASPLLSAAADPPTLLLPAPAQPTSAPQEVPQLSAPPTRLALSLQSAPPAPTAAPVPAPAPESLVSAQERAMMVQRIAAVLARSRPEAEAGKLAQLPLLACRLEAALLGAAGSREEYLDCASLPSRLRLLTQRAARRRAAVRAAPPAAQTGKRSCQDAFAVSAAASDWQRRKARMDATGNPVRPSPDRPSDEVPAHGDAAAALAARRCVLLGAGGAPAAEAAAATAFGTAAAAAATAPAAATAAALASAIATATVAAAAAASAASAAVAAVAEGTPEPWEAFYRRNFAAAMAAQSAPASVSGADSSSDSSSAAVPCVPCVPCVPALGRVPSLSPTRGSVITFVAYAPPAAPAGRRSRSRSRSHEGCQAWSDSGDGSVSGPRRATGRHARRARDSGDSDSDNDSDSDSSSSSSKFKADHSASEGDVSCCASPRPTSRDQLPPPSVTPLSLGLSPARVPRISPSRSRRRRKLSAGSAGAAGGSGGTSDISAPITPAVPALAASALTATVSAASAAAAAAVAAAGGSGSAVGGGFPFAAAGLRVGTSDDDSSATAAAATPLPPRGAGEAAEAALACWLQGPLRCRSAVQRARQCKDGTAGWRRSRPGSRGGGSGGQARDVPAGPVRWDQSESGSVTNDPPLPPRRLALVLAAECDATGDAASSTTLTSATLTPRAARQPPPRCAHARTNPQSASAASGSARWTEDSGWSSGGAGSGGAGSGATPPYRILTSSSFPVPASAVTAAAAVEAARASGGAEAEEEAEAECPDAAQVVSLALLAESDTAAAAALAPLAAALPTLPAASKALSMQALAAGLDSARAAPAQRAPRAGTRALLRFAATYAPRPVQHELLRSILGMLTCAWLGPAETECVQGVLHCLALADGAIAPLLVGGLLHICAPLAAAPPSPRDSPSPQPPLQLPLLPPDAPTAAVRRVRKGALEALPTLLRVCPSQQFEHLKPAVVGALLAMADGSDVHGARTALRALAELGPALFRMRDAAFNQSVQAALRARAEALHDEEVDELVSSLASVLALQ